MKHTRATKISIVGDNPAAARLMASRPVPTTIHTADGSQVTITRRGIEFDLETRNAKGETISTVVMNSDDVSALLAEMNEELAA
ncbi:hypothetical protein [Streptomyces sp. ITFR-6]|uniref:hypothetical protein n=1 Tax=Streptomyces sp. ITFR-6 TaxID=3075197 RepID=UPI00288BE529|nr:hypothetical protein [Streptomyces sp. ITFR-6]WNI28640.1 hypothetical protein RLT59_07440 [Streptomyces sp. ITFR-6]